MKLSIATLTALSATTSLVSGMTIGPLPPFPPIIPPKQMQKTAESSVAGELGPRAAAYTSVLTKATAQSASSTSVQDAQPTSIGESVYEAKEQVLGDLSSLFGYLSAGGNVLHGLGLDKLDSTQLMDVCAGTTAAFSDRYDAIGLNTTAIFAPICGLNTTTKPSEYGVVNSIYYNAKIFTTQLINMVNTTSALNTMCSSLRLDLIDFFPLIGEQVKDGVCSAAGTVRAPQGFKNNLKPNPAAVQAAKNTQSVLFAILTAVGFQTPAELSALCDFAPQFMDLLDAEQINGTLVESTLCRINQPLSVQQAKAMVKSWMTRYFVTVLENVSNAEGWKGFLCRSVDVAGLEGVGLSGEGVMAQVCRDRSGDDGEAEVNDRDSEV
ncbi:uncharacterized protein LTR77_006435 [Saxophila tyrrhenica]|uniref:Uncharacterized protein n=1 Tax=Saxophila tyrrhenica TaxID=1690608 RepID=A0AAV9P7V8_9PEZI|nr:hypothetical protein LTR77_006435 [Saxophila tyrrhenica]